MTSRPLPSIHARDVHGFCPACGNPTLRLGDDSRIVCTLMDCPRPDLVNELIGDIADARQHGAFVFCGHHIGYAAMREFAVKITEKVTAVGQRAEAVAYANEQKQRAERAEAAIARVRRLCEMTIASSVRVQAIDQARDTLAALDGPTDTAADIPADKNGPTIANVQVRACESVDNGADNSPTSSDDLRWPLESEGE